MERETQQEQPPQVRKGQTLVEFAITLPLLLVLMFGIIEFGRIFQAWISIQNAARVSARYASTGQYLDQFDELIFDESLENGTDDAESIVPCVNAERVGIYSSFPPAPGSEPNGENYRVTIAIDEGLGNYESLFGTWWGKDCEPRLFEPDPINPGGTVTRVNATDQFLRLDLLRIPSIYASAVQGAGGLAIDPMPVELLYQQSRWNDNTDGNDPDVNNDGVVDAADDLDGNGTPGDAGDIDIARDNALTGLGHEEARRRLSSFLYSVWHPTYPMHPNLDLTAGGNQLNSGVVSYRIADEPSFSEGELDSYFLVTICSNRSLISDNGTFIDGDEANGAQYANRFVIPVYEPSLVANDNNEPQTLRDWAREIVSENGDLYNDFTDMPACFLNEEFPEAQNEARRWSDPGGPGDTVDIQVTFYHPLITPLGLARFIPMHARRSAVVESFYNTTSQTGNIPGGPGGPGGFDTLTPRPTDDPSETPVPTDPPTATFTPTATNTPTVTPTFEEQVFSCPNVTLVEYNTNHTGTDRAIGFNPGSVVFIIKNDNNTDARLISTDLHWSSADWEADNNLAPVPGYGSFFFDEFELGGNTQWNGSDYTPETDTQSAEDPGALPVELTISAKSEIKFEAKFKSGPNNLGNVLPLAAFDGTTFRIRDSLTLEECDPLVFNSTTTDNVNSELELACDTGEVTFAASNNALRENGWVQLFVTNSKDAPVTIDGFDITWGPWEDRYRNDSTRSLALQRVYLGGDTPPQGDLLWSSANGNNGTGIVSLTNNAGTLDDPNIYTTVSDEDGLWAGAYTIPGNGTLNLWLDFTGNSLTDESFGFLVSDLNASTIDVNCDDIDEDDVGLEDVPSPEPTVPTNTPVPDDNMPPVANDDVYTLSNPSNVFSSVTTSQQSVLDNDTDCADTTFVATGGDPTAACSMEDATSGDPSRFTSSGDNPLTVANCPRTDIGTTRGAQVQLACDGTFTYNPTEADEVCEAGSITDTFSYKAKDSRDLPSAVDGIVSINITNPSTNQRPVQTNNNDILVTLDTGEGETSYEAPSNPGSNQNLNYLFNDEDGDTLTFTKTSGPGWVTVNNDGSWTVNVPQSLIDQPDGTVTRRTITVQADDGSGICATQTNTFRIEIIGSGDEPPTPLPTDTNVPPTPVPTATEDDFEFGGGG